MSEQTIVVAGDYMFDRYWLGQATRISPEAPCMVVKIENTFLVEGGAGNVWANVDALGAQAIQIGMVGPIKNRLQVGDTQIVRWDEGDTCKPIASIDLPKGVHPDKIIIADYAKGTITPSLIEQIRLLGLPTFVDTKADPTPYTGWATAIFPNAAEYKQFETQYNLFERCILKLGADGIVHLRFGKPVTSYPAFSTNPVSVNGAGDVVIAAYAFKYPHSNALHFANLAAAAAVEKPYTSTVTIKEINAIKRRLSNNRRRSKGRD